MSDLRYGTITAALAAQCAELERAAFPHAEPEELLTHDDIVAYSETFAEGFVVCCDGDRVVGQAAGIFIDFDFDHPQHTIHGITGEHQCGNHRAEGPWYYGTDIVVHPDYRRRGIGGRLYELRKDLVRRHNRRGIIAGGHLHDFARHKGELTAAEYIERVAAGELYDATLTFQIHNGFEAVAALEDYLTDASTDNWAALIVWRNPEYRAAEEAG